VNHLMTRHTGNVLEMYFNEPDMDNKAITFSFSRAVIGCVFPITSVRSASLMNIFCVVVAERIRESLISELRPSKSYLVIDESEGSDIHSFSKTMIALKDKYLCQTVFCPNAPAFSVQALRDLEGLTHYADESIKLTKIRHRTFVSGDTVAGIFPMPLVEEGQIQQELNGMLREEILNPDTRFPIMAGGNRVMRKLMFPSNLPTEKTREGMQSANPYRMAALWLAVHGLENTMSASTFGGENWHHKPGRSGY